MLSTNKWHEKSVVIFTHKYEDNCQCNGPFFQDQSLEYFVPSAVWNFGDNQFLQRLDWFDKYMNIGIIMWIFLVLPMNSSVFWAVLINQTKKSLPSVQNQGHTSSRCHCHGKGIGSTFKLVLNDRQLCTCQEENNAFLSQVFRKHVFQIACHWIFVFYLHNTLFTWLSYGDENIKQFFGFTYSAVMSVLKIVRSNTWGQDTLVSISHYCCSVFLNWPIYSIFLIV